MPKIVVNLGWNKILAAINKETRQHEVFEMRRMSPQMFYDTLTQAERDEIAVALFIDDTDHRSLKEVADDMGVSYGTVKMMRFQLKNEGRKPSRKRMNLINKLYGFA
jgi:uncharacterized protein (DUF1786 family)